MPYGLNNLTQVPSTVRKLPKYKLCYPGAGLPAPLPRSVTDGFARPVSLGFLISKLKEAVLNSWSLCKVKRDNKYKSTAHIASVSVPTASFLNVSTKHE